MRYLDFSKSKSIPKLIYSAGKGVAEPREDVELGLSEQPVLLFYNFLKSMLPFFKYRCLRRIIEWKFVRRLSLDLEWFSNMFRKQGHGSFRINLDLDIVGLKLKAPIGVFFTGDRETIQEVLDCVI